MLHPWISTRPRVNRLFIHPSTILNNNLSKNHRNQIFQSLFSKCCSSFSRCSQDVRFLFLIRGGRRRKKTRLVYFVFYPILGRRENFWNCISSFFYPLTFSWMETIRWKHFHEETNDSNYEKLSTLQQSPSFPTRSTRIFKLRGEIFFLTVSQIVSLQHPPPIQLLHTQLEPRGRWNASQRSPLERIET